MKQIEKRLWICFIIIFFIPVGIILRLFYLQIWQHQRYESYLKSQFRKEKSNITRGTIQDCNNRTLSTSILTDSMFVNPKLIQNREIFVEKISKIIKLDKNEIIKKISQQNSYFVWIKHFLDYETSSKIKELQIDGVGFKEEYKRYQPYSSITSSILGVVGTDGKGLAGLEFLFNEQLNQGMNIKTTIDLNLQFIVYNKLKEIVEKYQAKKAFGIIQQPFTGEILALTSYPSFDPNSYEFESNDLINPAINEIFEPGSTLKPIISCAALEQKLLSPQKIIYCENGSYNLTETVEINDHEKYGYLSFEGVLAYSSNIGFAKIGSLLGKNKIYYWIRNFGFGSPTGSLFPGEQYGIVPDPYSRKWSKVTSPIISFGQGISVTGLQIINAFSSIANGGLLLEPSFVKELLNTENKAIWISKPKITRRVITEQTSKTIKEMLVKVCEYGTGKLANVEGFSVAGKTGTAQKIDPQTKKYSNLKYIASFCGFIPAQKPELTILIVVDEPKTNYWASDIACPAFSNIAQKSINYLNIRKNKIKMAKL